MNKGPMPALRYHNTVVVPLYRCLIRIEYHDPYFWSPQVRQQEIMVHARDLNKTAAKYGYNGVNRIEL